jgi:hypothetical protein
MADPPDDDAMSAGAGVAPFRPPRDRTRGSDVIATKMQALHQVIDCADMLLAYTQDRKCQVSAAGGNHRPATDED